jgi:superfamily II DNA or RNA helicase
MTRPVLRPYQDRGIKALREHVSAGRKRVILCGPCASGKTVWAAWITRSARENFNTKVLFLVHRIELIDQTVAKFAEFGIENVGVIRADDSRANLMMPVQVASVWTLARHPEIAMGFDIVFVDECFPAGTPIDGQPIERVKVGDEVSSFDPVTGELCVRRVVRTFCRRPSAMVRVHFSDGRTLACTPNHKLWTQEGWVEAGSSTGHHVMLCIYSDEENTLRAMRNKNLEEEESESTSLLRSVHRTPARGEGKEGRASVLDLQEAGSSQGAERADVGEGRASILFARAPGSIYLEAQGGRHLCVDEKEPEVDRQTNDEEQSDAKALCSREAEHDASGDEMEAARSWGQRDGANCTGDVACVRAGLAVQRNRSHERRMETAPLQNRCRQREPEGCDRSRRTESSARIEKETGSAKGSPSTFSRVDRVEVLEPTGDGTFGGVCSDGLVYNFEVEDTHAYFANGVAVSNCHLSLSDSYLKVMDLYPNATFIGLTATPHRMDGKPLKDRWDAIEPAATYSDLIRDKFIMAPRIFSPEVKPDLKRVHTREGDYVVSELEGVMTESAVLGDLVPEWKKHAGGLRTVAFAVSVEHSKSIAARFLEAGIPAAHIDAQTPLDVRKSTLAKLDSGELKVVSNVDILTAGWNQPSVKCLIDARPTKSLVRYLQAGGRVLRVWEENGQAVTPIILDHACNVDRHNFPHMDRKWTLDGPAAHSKKAPAVCIKCQSFIEHYPCPWCGFAPPAPPPREAKEVKDVAMRERTFEDPRRIFFEKKLSEAKERGFKPGFAAAQYKDEFEEWPPWAWSQEAKDKFAADKEWQKRQAGRSAERAHWEARERVGRFKSEKEREEEFLAWARDEDSPLLDPE